MHASSTLIPELEMEVHASKAAQKHEAPVYHPVWKTSILFTLVTAVIFGLAYPFAISGIAHLVFPHQADGSLVLHNGQIIGSSLLAQSFTSDRYFHPRPSAAGNGYDATASGGSNLAQTNARLIARIQGDIDRLQKQNSGNPVPIDMVTQSASGLDPDITPDNAYYQAPRVATARNIPEGTLDALIKQHIEQRTLGLLGEPRVNVLELNLALDQIAK
jgi:K+-transporting ATPase ATPase C chain